MYLDINQMNEINKVQLEIFKVFLNVCNRLALKYYMAHGSLLGAVRYEGFFPFDDDIDILMPRKDYDTLIKHGQELLSSRYFIQSCKTEDEYPLAFAKIRDSETAFIQTAMDHLNINKGIYIDIFPLDYFPKNKLVQKLLDFKDKIYSARINSRLIYDNPQLFKSILRSVSIIFCPSWKKAVQKRADLYVRVKQTSMFVSVGGKKSEKGMPVKWFGKERIQRFEKMDVSCPSMLEEYLTRIYGDYLNYNPAAKYMDDQNRVKVSAYICSTKESYKTIKGKDK